jgi:hypothetical protein
VRNGSCSGIGGGCCKLWVVLLRVCIIPLCWLFGGAVGDQMAGGLIREVMSGNIGEKFKPTGVVN